MYYISIKTFSGVKLEYTIIEEEYMLFYFKTATQAVDAERVYVTNALTGELIWEWDHKNHITFANGVKI